MAGVPLPLDDPSLPEWCARDPAGWRNFLLVLNIITQTTWNCQIPVDFPTLSRDWLGRLRLGLWSSGGAVAQLSKPGLFVASRWLSIIWPRGCWAATDICTLFPTLGMASRVLLVAPLRGPSVETPLPNPGSLGLIMWPIKRGSSDVTIKTVPLFHGFLSVNTHCIFINLHMLPL